MFRKDGLNEVILSTALDQPAVLVLADTAARAILPEGELPVGIVTGAIGGPFFLLLLRRSLAPGI